MKVLTANRLIDGEAVWFARDGSWAEGIEASEVVDDRDGEARLEAAGKAAYDDNLVVDVAVIDVELVDGRITPTRLRERIRVAGPTNRLDLGKQARPDIDHA